MSPREIVNYRGQIVPPEGARDFEEREALLTELRFNQKTGDRKEDMAREILMALIEFSMKKN